MIEQPKDASEALRSPTLESLASRVVPGSILTVHTGRTDYRVRVTEAYLSGPARDMMGIQGSLVDATNKLEAGVGLSFFVPIRTPGESLRVTTSDGKVLATSGVREYSLEPSRKTDESLEASNLADYQGERWVQRLQTEAADMKRGIQALLAILPEELHLRGNEVISLMSEGAMDGTKSLEEYGRNEARRHAEGEELKRRLGWLKVAHALLKEMLKDGVATHWTVAAQQLNLTEKQARDALGMLAQDLQAKYIDQLIGDPAKHFLQERAIGDKDPQIYEAEAQRLLGLRDANAVLESIRKGGLKSIEEKGLKQP